MIIGFTGTSDGMTEAQQRVVFNFLRWWVTLSDQAGSQLILVHGDCIGSDAQADAAAVSFGIPRILRPCNIRGMRAFCDRLNGGQVFKVHRPVDPMKRNTQIVKDVGTLIATPKGEEVMRSGTWSTVRRARKYKRQILIVMPNGEWRTE